MSCSSSPSPPLTPPTSDSEFESLSFDTSQPNSNYINSLNPNLKYISSPSPHPFAASMKADRAPPAYEKKLRTPPATPPEFRKTLSPRHEQAGACDTPVMAVRPNARRSTPLTEDEQMRWDVAISSAVDRAETKLDLSSANLTYIPPSIIDLKNLVVLINNERTISTTSPRTFVRSITAPALLPAPPLAGARPFLPSQTTNRLAFGVTGRLFRGSAKQVPRRSRCEVELYLMRNAIRRLPRELFALDCLVVLSLRQNKLSSLPPAIGRLTNLRELNVANNRLTHLPAEIQRLCLESLHLHPNRFIAPPLPIADQETNKPKPKHEVSTTRNLGSLTRRATIPTLTEILLRYLLSPDTHVSTLRSKTRLEVAMSMAQIDTLPLPSHIQRIVRASTGHERAYADKGDAWVDAEEDMSMNSCPSPHHCGGDNGGMRRNKGVRFLRVPNVDSFSRDAPVFGIPVEERMEWVGVVAGVQVAESPGAWVPLLWRGCGQGCLDFLMDADNVAVKETFTSGSGVKDEEFQFSDDDR